MTATEAQTVFQLVHPANPRRYVFRIMPDCRVLVDLMHDERIVNVWNKSTIEARLFWRFLIHRGWVRLND